MKKKLILIVTVLLVAAMLFGCGAQSITDGMGSGKGTSAVMDQSSAESAGLSGTGNPAAMPQLQNQKLVRKLWLEAETENMDPLLESIGNTLAELSGYVEARDVHNGSAYSGRRYRSAELTVRIPVEQADQFVSYVTENANIVSTNETVDNITLSYVATESRITALETEQTRLLELLAQAETMDDLLKIEERLTEVRTELEEVTSQKRLYDNMVDYATVYLTVTEVREFTVVEEPETVWERIGAGLSETFKDIGKGFTELFVFLVVSLPYFAIVAVLAVAVILPLRLKKRKKSKKQTEDGKE